MLDSALRPVETDAPPVLASQQSGFWTDARVDQLKKLHADGVSYTRIANKLSCTRSGIAGKIKRLGLASARPVRMVKSEPKPKPKSFAPRSTFAFPAPAKPKPQPIPPEPEPEPIAAAEAACTLLELESTSCRFPIGDPQLPDFYFCGRKAITGLPYCPFHAKRAFAR